MYIYLFIFLCECIKIIASIYAISYKETVRAMHSYKKGRRRTIYDFQSDTSKYN